MPPTQHSATEMHRSTDDTTGADVAAGLVLTTDGSGGFTYETGGGLDVGRALFLDHGTVGATEDIDQSVAMAHWITLDVNCTLTFSGAVATVDGDAVECAFRLYVEQDASGTNTITWPGSVVWPDGSAPTLDTTGLSVEILDFTTPDGGTTWYGFHGGGSAITVEDEGTPLATAASTLDFVGAGVTASGTGAEKTITISGAPTGAAGGDLSGTYPNPSVVDDSHSHTAATAPGGSGEILISDTHSTPLVFADLLQTEAGDDLLYADT